MKKSTLVILSSSALLLVGSAFKVLNSGGKEGFSGGPGETTCGTCHGNNGGASTLILSTPTFSGNTYIPGQTYTITVRVANGNFTKFGFACTIINSSNNDAGTMQNPASNTKLVVASSNNRRNATHINTFDAGTATQGNFTFEWIAPASGQVRLFAAGNAVDGTGGTGGGDKVSSTSMTLTAAGATNIKENLPVSALSVFQNPAFGSLNLSYFKSTSDDLNLAIYDLNGKEVFSKDLTNQQVGQVENSVKLNDLAAGAYFIGLKNNNSVVAKKLVVLQ
ncbi:MAG: choice-of-anchor V domain-containing protein [Bacteroidota bacterium]|jgi:hypothetical protein|nr:T9SS type A sorting domain-containing protein [Bacteroidota bacterium]MCA6443644.1 T9SS type A sorting domain-containing protein [Bacteroidota bacterium]